MIGIRKDMKELSDIRNYLYEQAENLWWASLWVAIGTPLLSLVAMWADNIVFMTILGFLAVISPIAIAWFREQATDITSKADKCRRLILYADGLGQEIAKHEIASVRAWTIGKSLKKTPFVAPYYSSRLEASPNRLADIVAESAFFTHQLVERVNFWLKLILSLSLILVIGILYISNPFVINNLKQANLLSTVAKSAATVIALLISGDFLLLIKKYSNLSSSAKEIFTKCVKMRDDNNLREKDILQIVEDYNIALLQNPPIPRRFYREYKDELNKIYRESHNLVKKQL